MSLVAYASSDEGEGSDVDETPGAASEMQKNTNELNQKPKENAPESNDTESIDALPIEDDEYDILPNQSAGLTLPAPKHTTKKSNEQSAEQGKTFSILSALPAPQATMAKVPRYDEEDELEDEVKPKAKQFADVPVPPSKQKKKKGVKITIPSLDDYDSDEDEPRKKKIKTAPGKSGLFSVLPAPKNATTKEVGRVLLPHSLARKPAGGNVTKKPVQTVSKVQANVEFNDNREDSDDEEDSVNFFSLGQEDKHIVPVAGPAVQNLPVTTVRDSSTGLTHEPSLRGPWLGPAAPASDLLGPSLKPASAPLISDNKPLTDIRDHSRNASVTKNLGSSDQPMAAIASSSSNSMEGPEYIAQHSADYGQNYYPEVGEVQSFMQDEEFLKLQGKKARGKEEVNIIDVHGDDQMSEVDLMKHMTEEKEMRSFSKKGKDMPSSQQRRKHQITYLAHQAKERELELKNAWAQNRQTKRQTQSKYGF